MKFLDSNDFCVAVGNDTITLAAVGDNNINLVDSKGKKINYKLHIVGNVVNYGASVSINGGADNDSIKNSGDKVTILGGTGNNTLSNGFLKVHKKEVVSGYMHGVPIYKDILVADESILGGSKVTIDAGDGRNLVSVGSGLSYVTINGGDDGDIIENYGSKVSIQGDNGKSTHAVSDFIYTDKGSNVTIDAGKDDDKIVAYHDVRASISGGAGNDYINLQRISADDADKLCLGALATASAEILIKNFISSKIKIPVSTNIWDWLLATGKFLARKNPVGLAIFTLAESGKSIYDGTKNVEKYETLFKKYFVDASESTVSGGKGNDTIVADGFAPRVFEYKTGDGNDVIYGFENDDLLQIMTGFETSYSKKKNCVTFKMYDNGSITLKNFTATTFHVNSDVYQIVDNKFVKK